MADGEDRGEPNYTDGSEVNHDTLGLLFEHTKDAPADQLRDSEQLDTKATAVFVAATAAIGFAATLPQNDTLRIRFVIGALTDAPQMFYITAVDACIYLAAISWVATVVATLLNLRTRSYWRALQADDLWPDYASYQPAHFKEILVRDAARNYKENRGPLRRKARLFNASVLAVGLEGLFIVIALILAR